MRIGFVGLGRMGAPIARNLLRAGHALTVFNRSTGATEHLAAEGASPAASVVAAAREAELFCTMLPGDPEVEAVIFGSPDAGAITALPKGSIHVSLSTISLDLSRRLAEAHAEAGQGFVAAPVFGRPDVAEAAQLAIVAAGQPAHIEACREALESIGRRVFVVGNDPPAANVVKLAGNFILMSVIETLGEAFVLARKGGVAAEAFLDILNGTVFGSPMFQRYPALIADERFDPPGFALRLGLKDAGLVLDAGEGLQMPLPMASLVRDRLLSAVAAGLGDSDWAAMSRMSARDGGLEWTRGAS